MREVVFTYENDALVCQDFDQAVSESWSAIAGQNLLRYDQPKKNEHAKYVERGPFKFVFQYLKNRASLRRGRVQVKLHFRFYTNLVVYTMVAIHRGCTHSGRFPKLFSANILVRLDSGALF